MTDRINFWAFPDDARVMLFNRIGKEKKIAPQAAEKDWWVCHVIQAVFELRCAEALTFKGGTSLSKAWGVTQRFSEDVDLSIDKSFFGLEGDTRSARDRIRKLSRKYLYEEVMGELEATVHVFTGWESAVTFKPKEDSDADPTVLNVHYRSLLPPHPYIKPFVKLEFSCRNPREPREIRPVVPFAAELSPMIDFGPVNVPTVTPVRTFLEKVFLLHENFQKDHPRFRRMSRHLYDLYMLDSCGYADKAMADTALYTSLVRHRSVFNAIRGIDYSRHAPKFISIVPPDELLPLWKEDYASMQASFIYGDSPSFPELLKFLHSLQERIHLIPIDSIEIPG